jgi:hypothetical protein
VRKPSVPAIPSSLPGDHYGVLTALKENVEIMGGVRSATISQLPTTATLPEVIVALNKIIDRLSPNA